jgi:ABC-type dipeptide/oligopeptide/nickel transport system ATPase subunit
MIEVRDLAVAFEGVRAVDGVSFRVAAGEAYGIAGESGSGKSTVLRAISGLVGEFGGTVRIAGRERREHGRRELAKLVQMVFQDPYGSLHPRHTVDRTLAEPIAVHRLGDARRRLERALAEVGLGPEFRFRYPHQLSGGQRQRVAIARVLVLEPRVVLLDEPTSALDVSIQAEILALLRRLRRERGLTYLLVSHNLAVIAELCERVAVMNAGRIVEELDAAALRRGEAREPYTRRLVEASRGYRRHEAAAPEGSAPAPS